MIVKAKLDQFSAMLDKFNARIECAKCKRMHEGFQWELKFECFGCFSFNVLEGGDIRRLPKPPLKDDRYEDYMTCPHCGHKDKVDLVIRDYKFIGARPITPETYLVRLVEDVWYKMNREEHKREHDVYVDEEWMAKLDDLGYNPDLPMFKKCKHSADK